tara:strand:+ start:382 stop:585 length:204 start_codon:yes stop_codon:yes gene_type:complete
MAKNKTGPGVDQAPARRTGKTVVVRALKGCRPPGGDKKVRAKTKFELDEGVVSHWEMNGIVERVKEA